MRTLNFDPPLRRLLLLGAHADDIEIGCGGTVLRLLSGRRDLQVQWVVFSATPERAVEAKSSAAEFLQGVEARVVVHDYRDGFLPWAGAALKDEFEALKRAFMPDLIFTHYRNDLHQDHRMVSELTWNTWRKQMILEYEIPKYDGDFGSPNFFSPLPSQLLERKIALVLRHFGSQSSKHWFGDDVFRSAALLRGMECTAPEKFAEAFYCRKAVF